MSVNTNGVAAGTIIGGGTLRGMHLTIGNESTLAPLPPPEHPPTAPYHFLAYVSGDPSKWLGRAHVFIFPLWLLLFLVIVPTIFAMRWEWNGRRRRWRRKRGFCEMCGYDLRMTPD
jgi:hypothetical protein